MDPLYTVGQWWLPESPYVRVAGELQFSPKDGVTLNLVGDPLGRGKDHDESSYPVVYGIIAGAEVTLLEVIAAGRGFSLPGPKTFRFRAEYVLVGGHVLDDAFDSCSARMSVLDEWSHFGGVDMPPPGTPSELGFIYNRPEPFKAEILDGVDLKLIAVAGESHFLTEHKLTWAAWWQLRFPGAKTLREIESSYLHPLQDLLSVATDRPIAVRYFEVQKSSNGLLMGLKVGRQWSYTDEGQSSVGIPLFTANQLDFTSVVPRWFDLCKELREVRALALSDRFLGPLPVDNMFINIVGAAEALDRAKHPNAGSDLLERVRGHIDALIEAAPEDDRDCVKGYLKHTYDPSLKRRLVRLASEIGPLAQRITGEDISKWASAVRNARDGLTHRDGSQKGKQRDWPIVLSLGKGVEALVMTRLMQLAGIDEALIREAWDISN